MAFLSVRIMRSLLSPLRERLLVTPVYLMRMQYSTLHCWPLEHISQIKVTQNQVDGVIKSLTVRITNRGPDICLQFEDAHSVEEFCRALQQHQAQYLAAKRSDWAAYLQVHDDFSVVKLNPQGRNSHHWLGAGSASAAVLAVVLAVLAVSYNPDLQPEKPRARQVSSSYDKNDPSLTVTEPAPLPPIQIELNLNAKAAPVLPSLRLPSENRSNYQRPAKTPNGKAWPKTSGYVAGYAVLKKGGHSRLTVDNSQGDADIFAKLVSVTAEKAKPVRVFYIEAGSQFALEDIAAGDYEVRYQDLSTGNFTKSASFALTEKSNGDSIQYSNFRMTIYKVLNGNSTSYPIDESEF